MTNPTYIYDPENWDITYPWENRNQLADDLDVHHEWNTPVRLHTLVQGPDKWAAKLNDQVQWFDTEEEAYAAMRGPGFT